jgi:3-dehydroquinate dehydratase-1
VEKSDKVAKPGAFSARKFPHDSLRGPNVVAAVHTLAGLRLAVRLRPGDADVVEIRADALRDHPARVERAMAAIRIPVLLTVRHPAEGGIGRLSRAQRRELFLRLLPYAGLVDIELRSLAAWGDVSALARVKRVKVVVSSHHFHSTPSLARMLELERKAFRGGADIFKLAALAPSAQALARLLEFSAGRGPGPRAVMGMGAFGRVSRLALAQAGSILNYGYLDRPNAPGQWEARELKRLLRTLAGS